MAISSRYRSAFSRAKANAAGPPLPEVSGFTPGSVTTPAAILKGISMYAKARRDEANAKAANAEAAEQASSLQRSQDVADDYTRAQTERLRRPEVPDAPKPVATPVRITLSKQHQQLLGLDPSPDNTYAKDDVATALGIYRSRTRPTSGGGSGRPASASAVKQEANAAAHNQFMKADAPLLGNHIAILMRMPYVGVDGQRQRPNDSGRYATTSEGIALDHLGIDPEAWDAHSPERFPTLEKKDKSGAVVNPDGNATVRANATVWRQKTLDSAIANFRTQRIAQYASQYISPTDDAAPSPDANTSADQQFDVWDQDFNDHVEVPKSK